MLLRHVKQLIKQVVSRLAPETAIAWQATRERRHIQQFEQRMGLVDLKRTYLVQHELAVADGPFTGMKYLSEALCSALVPKLVGSYEAELHQIIAQTLNADYKAVIDIGCAEGYYANGFAMRLPLAIVYAFDIDAEAQRLCKTMAQMNDLQDRVIVSGKCDPKRLNDLLSERSLIICDCEGYEEDLLRPELIPALAQTDILVELHDHIKPGIGSLLQKRLENTHYSIVITAVERNPDEYPKLLLSNPIERQLAVSEFRSPKQQWAFFEVKPRSTSA